MKKTEINYRQTAAQIFLSKGKISDNALFILELLLLLDLETLPKVIEAYKQILANELKIVQIFFVRELTSLQKEKIEKHIIGKFGENLVFIYNEDKSLVEGIRIQVNDILYDLSIKSLI